MSHPLLEARSVRKEFGDVVANRDVDFELERGEVHSILGANGAGKSTFMKILYGIHRRTDGKVFVDGAPYNPNSPADALNQGIGLVFQEFKLIEPFSVLDNITLGLDGATFDDNSARHREEIAELSETLGLGLADRLDWRVSELAEGEKQRVEILKILYRDVDILLLDEPTSILTPQEVDEFFGVLERLVEEEDLGIVLITHKLDEALAISDRITVLRDGEVVGETTPADVDSETLAEMMVGHDDVASVADHRVDHGETDAAMRVDGLTVRNARGQVAVDDVSLTVHDGEIFGIVGVEGNGQTELARAVSGLLTPDSGRVDFHGTDVVGASRKGLQDEGLLLIPDSHGVVEEFEIPENCILDDYEEYHDNFVIQGDRMRSTAQRVVEEYSVKIPGLDATASQLSGGNKQKLTIGRKLGDENRRMVVAVNPTKGIDVDTKRFIHDKLVQERNEGRSVLLVTTDLDEALSICDRLAVINDGRIVSVFDDPASVTKQEVGLAMTESESR